MNRRCVCEQVIKLCCGPLKKTGGVSTEEMFSCAAGITVEEEEFTGSSLQTQAGLQSFNLFEHWQI